MLQRHAERLFMTHYIDSDRGECFHPRIGLLGFLPTLVSYAVRYKKIFRKEIFSKIVKLHIVCAETVRGSDSGDAGELVHVLY